MFSKLWVKYKKTSIIWMNITKTIDLELLG